MKLIWATRGRTWGFRFLRDGGFTDPLVEYEKFFSRIEAGPEAWLRNGGNVAFRFPDPSQRQDFAGRVIPHEFVIFGSDADGIDSASVGQERIWPLLAEEFALIWDLPEPPQRTE